jgi:hypothetical protein
MSTYRQIIERVDLVTPNALEEQWKLRWLMNLNGRIAVEVFQLGIEEVRELEGSYPESMEWEPLVTYPHEDIYDLWLRAQIDLHNGETDRYQNAITAYNAAYISFVCWFANYYDPGKGTKEV